MGLGKEPPQVIISSFSTTDPAVVEATLECFRLSFGTHSHTETSALFPDMLVLHQNEAIPYPVRWRLEELHVEAGAGYDFNIRGTFGGGSLAEYEQVFQRFN